MNKKEIQLFLKLEGIFSSFPVDRRENLFVQQKMQFNYSIVREREREKDLFNSF